MKDDFSSLIGKVKKVETNVSEHYYQPPKMVKKNNDFFDHDFEEAPISRETFSYDADDFLEFRANGVSKSTLQDLYRGRFKPFQIIDLHGMTLEEAEVYLYTTIENLSLPHQVCFKVIHGKGYQSKGRGRRAKLKNFTANYLNMHPRVTAFCSCPPNHGGTGALYVLLKKTTSKEE